MSDELDEAAARTVATIEAAFEAFEAEQLVAIDALAERFHALDRRADAIEAKLIERGLLPKLPT